MESAKKVKIMTDQCDGQFKHICISKRESQTKRETDRQADRHTDLYTGRNIDRHRGRHANRIFEKEIKGF